MAASSCDSSESGCGKSTQIPQFLLEEHEPPAITKLSLRKQVLQICCIESTIINDPKGFLAKTMDPPNPEVVEDALRMLLSIQALQRSPSGGNYKPTFYGRVLASLPLSLDASILVVKFGSRGMLREGILLGALMDAQSLPIVHPVGEESLFQEYVDQYLCGGKTKTILDGRKREEVLMANLCAFQFWQRFIKDMFRLNDLTQLMSYDKYEDIILQIPNFEQEWCDKHYIVHSSLCEVSEMYEDTLSSLHRFRPHFITIQGSEPTHYHPYEYRHNCFLVDKTEDNNEQTHRCVSTPFVYPDAFKSEGIAGIILEGCQSGDSCLFSHASGIQTPPLCLPEECSPSHILEDYIPKDDEKGCILVFDDVGMHFTSSIAKGGYPSRRIISTSSSSGTHLSDSSLADATIFWGLKHPYETIISKAGKNPIPWHEVKCVLWFLNPDSYAETPEKQKTIIQNFFQYMAIRILGDELHKIEIPVVLTMNNVRFSHLQVERVARDSFFFLGESFPHIGVEHGEFSDALITEKSMHVSKPFSYVFTLHKPSHDRVGNSYVSVLHKALHKNLQ